MTDEEYLGFVMAPENRRVFEILKLKDDRARLRSRGGYSPTGEVSDMDTVAYGPAQ